MSVIIIESSLIILFFEDFFMTFKKRGKYKKNRKVEEKTIENFVFRKLDSDFLDFYCVDRLDIEISIESDRNLFSEVFKKNGDNLMEKMDVEYFSKDNGFFDKIDIR